jgi:hypothetical protein
VWRKRIRSRVWRSRVSWLSSDQKSGSAALRGSKLNGPDRETERVTVVKSRANLGQDCCCVSLRYKPEAYELYEEEEIERLEYALLSGHVRIGGNQIHKHRVASR